MAVLAGCLSDFTAHRFVVASQQQVLAKVAAILCIGMTAEDGTDDAVCQAIQERAREVLQSLPVVMNATSDVATAAICG